MNKIIHKYYYLIVVLEIHESQEVQINGSLQEDG